jgi:2-iminobutanoate/2-iminopropanoate deaminase
VRNAVKTDKAPLPLGPYSQAIIEGDLVYVAGQGPTDPKTRERVGGDVRAQTEQTLANIRAILEACGSSLDKVVRCNVYLTDMKDFAAMNEVYGRAFSAPFPRGRPSRPRPCPATSTWRSTASRGAERV